MAVYQGKLLSGTFNGLPINCQTGGTLTINVNVEETPPCKPAEGEALSDTEWVDNEVTSRAWTLSIDGNQIADQVTGKISHMDIMEAMIEGSPVGEFTFGTTQIQDYDHPYIWLFDGTGIITSFTAEGGETGAATYSLEITGKGKPNFTKTPVTT